jgi:hypothetical protein
LSSLNLFFLLFLFTICQIFFFPKKFVAKLTTIIRNFWWTGIREEANAKSLCLRAWKDICASKNEGGLGIRNLQALNQSLILMAA